jgi:hypothetical protein
VVVEGMSKLAPALRVPSLLMLCAERRGTASAADHRQDTDTVGSGRCKYMYTPWLWWM